jgi:tripartite-type tricarboxylate transporter receptor subunit TctC
MKQTRERDHVSFNDGFSLRTLFSGFMLWAFTVLNGSIPAIAASYPTRPVKVVVPFGAGTQVDHSARTILRQVEELLGQPFLIENRPGASGMPAAASVASADPDGYTLLFTTSTTHAAAPSLFKKVPYDPVKDFAPIARLKNFGSMLAAHPGVPAATIGELVAYAKKNPGKLEFGYGFSSGQIAGEVLRRRAGIEIVMVPYRANTQAVIDVVSGHIQLAAADMNTGLPQVRENKIRPLAVFSKERMRVLPDIPTYNETIAPGFDMRSWGGIFAPAKTPPEVINILATAFQTVVTKDEFKAKVDGTGIEVYWGGPDEFAKFVESEIVKWSNLAKEAGIQPQ